jgi:hypothetical protein
LAEAGLLGQNISRNSKAFPFFNQKPYNFGANCLADGFAFFSHPLWINENPLDNAYHYTDNLAVFIKRLGGDYANLCEGGHHCPQLLELADGDFAAVGPDITPEAIPAMPPGPGVGTNERVVRIPRRVMIGARAEIPAA